MHVLAVASEIYPLVKTGGLADVAGALPAALATHGFSVRTLVPGYPAVLAAGPELAPVHHFVDLFGGPADLLAGRLRGLDLLVLKADHLYDRPGNLYVGPSGKDWPDNAMRFAALSFIGAEIARGLVSGFAPSILHAHDWQGALAAAYVRFGPPSPARTVVTIHNLAFQGHFPAAVFSALGLPPAAFSIDGVEYFGGVGFLKGGLQCADAVTTVSPTYAAEIATPEGGMGLDGLLRARAAVLHGIVNGVDTGVWDPATDPHIPETYEAASLDRRRRNKRAVETRFGLREDDGPLFSVVSRLTHQKGVDLIELAVDALVASGGRLAVLGSGDSGLEGAFHAAAQRHRGAVGVVTAYDEPLSHVLQAGADAILVPSRFEPCGLTQLYGLRYGCLPIVSRVGGLADTVIDANDAAMAADCATGIQFQPVDRIAFGHALERARSLYADREVWTRIQRNGMRQDVSWTRSAARYAELYRALHAGTPSEEVR